MAYLCNIINECMDLELFIPYQVRICSIRAWACCCHNNIFNILLSIIHSSFCRDIDLTEKLDYSSAVAVLGYSLILTLLRIFNVKEGATRVMFAAPILAFVTTHILYLNFYELDYGEVPFASPRVFLPCIQLHKQINSCASSVFICLPFLQDGT